MHTCTCTCTLIEIYGTVHVHVLYCSSLTQDFYLYFFKMIPLDQSTAGLIP